jgi:hypothetical protein
MKVSQIFEVNFVANFSSRFRKPGYERLTGLVEGGHGVLCVGIGGFGPSDFLAVWWS